jgi:opacity protein-like surface antigen
MIPDHITSMEDFMALKLHSLCAACAALLCATAGAADFTPAYAGVDYGATRAGGRAYAGWTLGSEPIFDSEATHYFELMGFSLGYYGVARPDHQDYVRVNGLAFNWATSTRISGKWSAKTRIGVDVLHARIYGAEHEPVRTWDNVSGLAGAGLAYAVDRHWVIRGDVNYMPMKVSGDPNPRSNTVTTGLDYKF